MALKSVRYIREGGPNEVNVAGLGKVRRGETIALPPDVASNLVSTLPAHWEYADAAPPEEPETDEDPASS